MNCRVPWVLLALVTATSALAQGAEWQTYRDPRGRFTLSVPLTWGSPAAGTNVGFGNRLSALRFPNLAGLGGEIAVLQGRVTLDLQALGGLYDPIALEVIPEPLRMTVIETLTPITAANVCVLLGSADHLADASTLPDDVRRSLIGLDRMRNVAPRVVQCARQDTLVVFHKEASFEAGAVSTRQHIFGAVRFLTPPYSAVTLVRALNTPPSAEALTTIARVVRSFSAP